MGDRLSALPDSILTHLLSFLPTKECVATSILSTRWRYLWQYVPVLDLSLQNPATISRVVSLHKVQRLDAFRLSFDSIRNSRRIEKWIITAVERSVRELLLSFGELKYVLPSPLFTCQTLVDLRLERCRLCPLNLTRVSLPHLKILLLNYIRFKATDSLTRLISGCPVLEELQIQDVVYGDKVEFIISSTTIKRLELQLCFEEDDDYLRDYYHEYTVQLDTPALKHLLIDDRLCDELDSGPLPSLIEADIEVSYHGDADQYFEDAIRYYRSVFNFINKLTEAKSLKIYFECWILDRDALLATWTPSSFHELTTLDLNARICFLPKFLESANILQRLSFRDDQEHLVGRDDWIDPQRVPTCLLSSLRTIQLRGLGVDVQANLEMVRYLLKNALILETMEISFTGYKFNSDYESDSEIEAAVDEISLFERGSKTCELRFI